MFKLDRINRQIKLFREAYWFNIFSIKNYKKHPLSRLRYIRHYEKRFRLDFCLKFPELTLTESHSLTLK